VPNLTPNQVVLEHYRVKHGNVVPNGSPHDTYINTELRKAHAILYRPYEFLDHPSSPSEYPGHQRISIIEGLIESGQFREARHESHQLIKTTLSGLRYLETYDRTLIRTIVTVAYTGWIAFSAVFILAPSRPLPTANRTPLLISLLFGLVTVGLCVLFAAQKLPWTLHVYILFPFSFWHDVTRTVYANWSAIRGHSLDTKWIASTLIGLLVAASVLQSMVVRSFHVPSPLYENLNGRPKVGYTTRTVWSVGFVAIGVGWPLTSWPKGKGKFLLPWAACCITTAVFPLLSVNPSESLVTM